jgi:hypothetical protein
VAEGGSTADNQVTFLPRLVSAAVALAGSGKDPAIDSPIDPGDRWLAIGGMVVLDDFIPAGQPGPGLP